MYPMNVQGMDTALNAPINQRQWRISIGKGLHVHMPLPIIRQIHEEALTPLPEKRRKSSIRPLKDRMRCLRGILFKLVVVTRTSFVFFGPEL